MYKYLLFIIFGIILYLLYNTNENFSISTIANGTFNQPCDIDLELKREIIDDHCDNPFVCVIENNLETVRPPDVSKYWIDEDSNIDKHLLEGKCVKKRWDNDKGDPYFYPSIYDLPDGDAAGVGGLYESPDNIRLQNILVDNLSKTNIRALGNFTHTNAVNECYQRETPYNTDMGCDVKGDLVTDVTYMGNLECSINNDCYENHIVDTCFIDCDSVNIVDIKNIPEYKTLETSGFQYFSAIDSNIDMNSDEMMNYIESINIQHRSENNFINELIYEELHFYEYLYMKYLEQKYSPYKAKKIIDNIFYINGKIIYILIDNLLGKTVSCGELEKNRTEENIELCRTATSQKYVIRFDFGTDVVLDDDTNSPVDSIIILPPSKGTVGSSASLLHIDFNRFDKYQKLDTDDDRFDKYVNKTVTESFFSVTDLTSMYQKMDGFFDKNIEIFNIWIMLDCSDNAKSLSFLDFGNNNINTERILDNLTDGDSDLKKYILGETIDYSKILEDDTIYNTLYTFNNMNPGDFYIFKSSNVPHIRTIQDNDTWRISCEVRYAIYEDEVPFDLGVDGVFDDTNEPISPTDKFNPTYFIDNILRYFEMEYDRVKDLYNLQLAIIISDEFNLDIFKSIIDNMSYKEYLDDEKVTIYIIVNL